MQLVLRVLLLRVPGVLAPAFGGGLTNAQVAAAGFGPEAGGIYAGRSGLASILDNKGTSMALQGLGKATARPQRQAMGSPPPPQRERWTGCSSPDAGRAGVYRTVEKAR